MTTDSSFANSPQDEVRGSLLTLSKYLERSLDVGKSVVMMRRDREVFSVYVGDPAAEEEDLKSLGTITATEANEILELTQVGVNRMTVGGQTNIADVGAVIFAPA
jgi:exosome complex RNA-binding protein Rrp42 (RNase PH superfamily)